MKAMILAAGGGTRLHPLTFNMPKPVAPIANVPCIEYIVRLLKRHGFDDLMVNLYHYGHLIEEHLGDGRRFDLRIRYSRETELMGTAGGVKAVEEFLREGGPFIVIGGDDLTDFDLGHVTDFHRKCGALATIGLTEVDEPGEYGVVVTSTDGRIRQFQEKPKPGEALSNLVNTGVYVFDPAVLELIPPSTFYDFGRQLFPVLVDRGLPFYGCRLDGYWCDVGDLHQYLRSHVDVMAGRTRLAVEATEVRPGLFLQEGAEVAPDVVVDGRVLVGAGSCVESGAWFEGTVVLGASSRVKRDAHLRHTVTWARCEVGEASRLSGVILGSDCVLGAGTDLASTVLAPGTRVEGTARALRLSWT